MGANNNLYFRVDFVKEVAKAIVQTAIGALAAPFEPDQLVATHMEKYIDAPLFAEVEDKLIVLTSKSSSGT